MDAPGRRDRLARWAGLLGRYDANTLLTVTTCLVAAVALVAFVVTR